MDSNRRKDDLEKEIVGRLTEGQMQDEDREKAVRRRLSPKYEIRIETPLDPIVEETAAYRRIAKEVDDRYDIYLAKRKPKGGPDGKQE